MTSDSQNNQIYGVPLYGASWVPLHVVRSTGSDDSKPDSGDSKPDSGEESSPPAEKFNPKNYLVLAGGGGEGRSGIPNEILLTHFDFDAYSLSDRPVARLGTGADLPYRMAVHPRGEGVVCSFPKSCRWYDWDMPGSVEDGKLGVKSSEKELPKLEDVGQQLVLAFNDDGSLLGVGGEDGKLRVFKWPSLDIQLNEEGAYTSVKDLHFSADGKYLVSVGTGGPCRVWNVTTSKVVASLPKKNDELFGYCRFSQNNNGDPVLYTTAMQSKGGSIILWSTRSWKRIATKQIVRDPVSAFNVSVDGKLLAIGTVQGDVMIIDSSKMQVQMVVKKAHLGIVTALTFSTDSRALGSASMDSSVRVTMIENKNIIASNGFNNWTVILIILLAIVVYFLKTKGMIPESLPFH